MSTPPLDPDDPRLTAYALGEADEADRQAIEAYLVESAAGRAEVEQTREIARVLAAEFDRERELYSAARSAGELPSNVVAFPGIRSRPWRRAAVLALKIAAVMAFAASLVYLTVRKPHRPEIVIATSAPSTEVPPAPAPTTVPADQLSKDRAVAVKDQEESDSDEAPAADRPSPKSTATAAAPTGSTADTRLAMERAEASDKASEAGAGGQVSGMAAAPPPNARDAVRSVPGAASTATRAAPRPARPLQPQEKVARSVVRVRTAEGKFFGGVLMTTDGLILAVTSLPENSLQQPCTVFLADGRELPAVAKPARTDSGCYWLRTNAEALPAAVLAKAFPATDELLVAASVDPLTGATTFPRVQAGDAGAPRRSRRLKLEMPMQAVGNASFAFNAAGELLVIDHAVREPQTPDQARISADSPETTKFLARPLTDAERIALQQAAKRSP